jgi:hypothetical protein
METAEIAFGLHCIGSVTKEEGTRMLRPDVVLSRKAGSNHIFGDLYRISQVSSCPGWRETGVRHYSGRGPVRPSVNTAHELRREADKSRPVLGPGS